jgi:protein gp37
MGCFKVSDGCKHCYADTLTTKKMKLDVFGHDTDKRKRTGMAVWTKPYKWNRDAFLAEQPARAFTMSLGDFFEDAPQLNQWREEAWKIIEACKWLDFQILTKRPENIERFLPDDWDRGSSGYPYWPNVWLGTSIEDNRVAHRADVLSETTAHIHFISYEPAIGPADQINLEGIEWMIVGGESGPGYRKMDLSWARDMQRRCAEESVPFFFKQNAAARTEMGIDALGAVYRDYPESWDRQALFSVVPTLAQRAR